MARNEAVGTARYNTEVDASGLAKGLTDADRRIKDTGAAAEKAFAQQGTNAVSKFSGGISGLIGKLNAVAKGGGVGAALLGGVGLGAGLSAYNLVSKGLGAVTDLMGDAGRAASDLNESQSKLTQVFPTQAAAIRAWAATSAQSMGQSTQAAIEATGTFGNFLQAMGTAQDSAAKMSMAMVQLAGDLGSFNNQDPTEVLQALQSGLAGETEPLRRFGVDVSDARVQAELLSEGVKKVGKDFTQTQKIQARYNLIMRQTTTAQGDYSRTATGTANAQRTLNAEIENAKAKVGGALNDISGKLAILGAQVLPPLIDGLTSWFGFFRDVAEFWQPWQKAARLAAEQTQAWTDQLAAMPGAGSIARSELEAIARRAQEAGDGLAGASAELQDLVRWSDAISKGGSQLVGMTRNFQKWSDWVDQGTISADQFDRKVRSMVQGGLQELEDNIDILPPKLAEVVRYFGSGQAAVDDFAKTWIATATDLNSGKIDVATWGKFLVDNVDFVSEHWKQIPVWMQEVMVKQGLITKQGVDVVVGHYQGMGDYLRNVLPGAFARMPKAAEEAGQKTGAAAEGAADSVQHAVRRMHMTLEEAAAPWREEWQKLVAWAKNPFKPSSFENWIHARIKEALKNAADTDHYTAEQRRNWAKVAKLMKDPVIQAGLEMGLTVDEALADIALVRQAGIDLRATILGSITGIFTGARPAGTGGAKTPKRRAMGGRAEAGVPYIVGEHRPELFVPEQSGRIVPSVPSTSSTVLIDLTPRAAAALRGAGFDDRSVATWLRDAAATAGHLYSSPRRS